MNAQDFHSLQEAQLDVYQEIDDAECSYGQTPKSRQSRSNLAQSRAAKPASEYGKRGEKTKKVGAAEKQVERMTTKPHRGRGYLGPADSEERAQARGMGEVGSGRSYSASGGSVTKNPKKLRKQKVMGELGEQVDIYDIILSHLLDEGYAETPEAAEKIMVNMSEEWIGSIIG